MNLDTEIASNFTVGRYREIRDTLSLVDPTTPAWIEVLAMFRRRVRERFLLPIRELARHDKKTVLPNRPGFAIMALDCLLIDTIQSFREGRVSTGKGEISPAASFKTFLKGRSFSDFTGTDRQEFFDYVRNGILHNGETRRDWKIRIDTPKMLVKDHVSGTKIINRRMFHFGVIREFRQLCREVKHSQESRLHFLRRMDAICGLPVERLSHFYFAYGSNLLPSELMRHASEAEPVGKAFLPAHKLEFTKHSISRGGDAANIKGHTGSMVWGFVYRMHSDDKERLRNREKGYREVSVTVYLKEDDDVTAQDTFTFQGAQECPKACGPSKDYLAIITQGARARGIPEEYIREHIEEAIDSESRRLVD